MISRNKSRYLETNEKDSTTTQSVQSTARAVLRGEFREFTEKQEKSQINNITQH